MTDAEIRARYRAGDSGAMLGRELGISRQAFWQRYKGVITPADAQAHAASKIALRASEVAQAQGPERPCVVCGTPHRRRKTCSRGCAEVYRRDYLRYDQALRDGFNARRRARR